MNKIKHLFIHPFGKLMEFFKKTSYAEDEPTTNDFINKKNQAYWHGLELPVGFINEENKILYRSIEKREITTGKVIRHVSGGILVQIPGGEVGLVEDKELDWSPEIGKKHFPIDSSQDVMVLSRRSTQRLFLSIRNTNFAKFFRESIKSFPIGTKLVRPISSIMDYGFFICIKDHIDIFIFKGSVGDFTKFKKNDLVEVNITGYDFERNRITGELL